MSADPGAFLDEDDHTRRNRDATTANLLIPRDVRDYQRGPTTAYLVQDRVTSKYAEMTPAYLAADRSAALRWSDAWRWEMLLRRRRHGMWRGPHPLCIDGQAYRRRRRRRKR